MRTSRQARQGLLTGVLLAGLWLGTGNPASAACPAGGPTSCQPTSTTIWNYADIGTLTDTARFAVPAAAGTGKYTTGLEILSYLSAKGWTPTGSWVGGGWTISGGVTFTGVPVFSGLSAGTIVSSSFIGLDSGNHLVLGAASGGSSAFSALTSGTNTTAAMIVGTGASLDFASTGTINAKTLAGSAIGTSGATIPLNNGNNTLSGTVNVTGTLETNGHTISSTLPFAVTGSGAQTFFFGNSGVPWTYTFPQFTTNLAYQSGAWVTGHCPQFSDTVGGISDSGSACGSGGTPANPTATAGPTAVNGSATTYMRSDAAPAVQTSSSSQLGLGECDNVNVVCPSGIYSISLPVETAATGAVTLASTDMGKLIPLGTGASLVIPSAAPATVLKAGQTVCAENIVSASAAVTNSSTGPMTMYPAITSIPQNWTLCLQSDGTALYATLNPASTSSGGAPVISATRRITASGAVTVSATTDYYICIAKGTPAATPVDLPATPTTGLTFKIKDCGGVAAADNITITPNSGNIDGAATYVMSTNWQAVEVIYDGTQWTVN